MERVRGVQSAESTFGIQVGKQDILIHDAALCGDHCCPFHNPSNHHMVGWEKNVRFDKRALVERLCPHGIGHPDPDSVAYFKSIGVGYMGVHGCDGCCEKN